MTLPTLTALVLTLGLTACSHLLSQKTAELAPSRQGDSAGELVTLPAQLRTTTIKTQAASFLSCAEPAPDVAMSDAFQLIAKASADRAVAAAAGASSPGSNKAEGSLDLGTATTALALDGRTHVVLLAREFLFRTCEAAANGWLQARDVKSAHAGTLRQISQMVAVDSAKAQVAGAVAATAMGIKLDKTVLSNTRSVANDTIQDACIEQLDACKVDAGGVAKALQQCTTEFKSCIK